MDCANNCGANKTTNGNAIANANANANASNVCAPLGQSAAFNWLTRENLHSAVAARINMNLVLRNTAASFSCPNTPVTFPAPHQDKPVTSTWTPTLTMPIPSIAMMDTLPLIAHLHQQQQQQQQQQQHLMVPTGPQANLLAMQQRCGCPSPQTAPAGSFVTGAGTGSILCPTVLPPLWFLQHRRHEESSVNSFSASASPASSTECSSPLDLSSKSSLNDIPSEADDTQTHRASILRNLLSSNSASSNDVSAYSHQASGENSCVLTPSSCASSRPTPHMQSDDCDADTNIYSALMDCKLKTGAECDDARVCLAKKNLHPVTSRVTNWLQQIVRFCEEIPAFKLLAAREQARLLHDSWHYLLLLCMAEQNFQFAVSVCSPERDDESTRDAVAPDVPTLRFVERLQSLIRKLHALALDRVEYGLLMTAVLFHSGQQQDSNLSPEKCAELSRLYNCVLSMLQQRMTMSRDARTHEHSPAHSSGYSAYTRLLLTLPAIYSIRQSLVQTFFFGPVNLDVATYVSKLLLKEAPEQAHTP